MFAHFKGLRLFFLSNFPEAMFIQGVRFIPDSRVSQNGSTNLVVFIFGGQFTVPSLCSSLPLAIQTVLASFQDNL